MLAGELRVALVGCGSHIDNTLSLLRQEYGTGGIGIAHTFGRNGDHGTLPLAGGTLYKRLAAACCYFSEIVSVRLDIAVGFVISSYGLLAFRRHSVCLS